MTWPCSHVARTRIPLFLLTVVDAMQTVTVHGSGRAPHVPPTPGGTVPTTVVPDLSPRLAAAARAVADAESKLAHERELRRRLVNDAVDEGMSQRAIARALGGGTGLVSKILATPEPEE